MDPHSGSYSSRNAQPPIPLGPDGYPQKRTSYRRPVDPQPAPATKPFPSNSARPVTAVPSGAPGLPPNGVTRTASHRRRQSQQIANAPFPPEQLVAAPDAPRGPPPTAYRDPYAPRGSSRSHASSRSYAPRPRDPTIHINPNRHQANLQITPDRLHSPADPLNGPQGPQGRRPSVPDRSPLQKLEGKLDDISKEERMTRIQEMELEAQERAEAEARARRALQAAIKQQEQQTQRQQRQRNVSGPTLDSSGFKKGPDRVASNRRHVSMPIPSKPRADELDDSEESDDELIYDLSEPWDPTGGGVKRTQTQPSRAPGFTRSGSQRQQNHASNIESGLNRNPSVKGKEAIGITRGAGSFRDRAGAPGGADERNQATKHIPRKPVATPKGLGLYGVENDPHAEKRASAIVGRQDSQRVSKDQPSLPLEQRKRDSRGIMAAQMEMEQERIDSKNGTRGTVQSSSHGQPDPARRTVGFTTSQPQAPADGTQGQEHHHHHHITDIFGHHEQERRYEAPPMLQEWKNAPVAALAEEDMDLDVPEPTSSGNKAWWEESTATRRRRSSSYVQPSYDGYVEEGTGQTSFNPPLYLKCGPLLRYTGLRRERGRSGKEREIWRGSVMIVTVDEFSSYPKPPTLRLFKQPMDLLPPPPAEIDAEGQPLNPAYVDPLEGQTKVSRSGKTLYVKPVDEIAENADLSRVEDDTGLFQATRIAPAGNQNQSHRASRIQKKDGEKLGKVREISAVRLHAERGVTFWRFNLEVELGAQQARIAYRINRGPAIGFWVPARGETMNIMFHSCNGFSYGVNPKDFCGPDPMWRDVLNSHQTRPFHVMIGGGDQIYNDAAMRETTLFRLWTESRNPLQKLKASFSEEMQNELEQFYLDRYSMWFSQGLFGMASSQIPMVNIWDDHDIIDGYGSYPRHFMSTPVFTGLGAVAFKYYMLFQHQSVPAETEKTEPSWILGAHPGPYIKERSRSVFMFLGKQVAFLGLDCRTERRREEILTEDSYDVIFDRLEDEIIKGETKHLIVLLGVPIAYPRLNFLENILTSRLMDPIKALGRTGILGNFVNKFDGGVEILDDLDDHWTAKHHKDERNWFIRELQHIASTKSVRVTILGGDVHLAAVGQFYTNKKLKIPKDQDHRYMPNVISSAIVNTPPPDMMADILNKRNKVHHLDPFTDEDMIPLFPYDVDGKKRNNIHLLPRRNWCSLREYKPGTTPPSTPKPPDTSGGLRLTRTLSDYRPGDMVRRMSGRGRRGRDRGPPVSYYNNPANAAVDQGQGVVQSSFSPDREEPPRSRRNSLTSLFRRRASVDSVNPPGSTHSMPALDKRSSFAQEEESMDRPSPFHRRPSVLGRKGLKQQGDFINLEGGLDICLNMEVSQKDPAGITTPYRLLVPALNYRPPEPTADVQRERRASRIGSIFGVLGPRNRRTANQDDHSQSGSSIASQTDGEDELDEEERARQRYKVGPRILIPGFSRKRNSTARDDSLPAPPAADGGMSTSEQRGPPGHLDERGQTNGDRSKARHVSAPMPTSTYTANATPALPPGPPEPPPQQQRSASWTRTPTHNSSHKSQLPAPAPVPEPKVHRRSMGGIINQPRDPAWERDAHGHHALPRTPSQQKKRESYPPHPAIVGAGPGSPYSRGGVEPRDDHSHHHHHPGVSGGGYFGSGGRNGSAGVGARYLGGGRYADVSDSESEDAYSDDLGEDDGGGTEEKVSQDSFVPPKTRSRWKVWKR